jgi:chromosome condensin MukBEF complex kleisin-like MukF subunit
MADFFENMDYDTATEIEQLSKLIYELRDNRNSVLATYGAENAAALLLHIQEGTLAEHPAYEHYLTARILTDTLETVRNVVGERLQEASRK